MVLLMLYSYSRMSLPIVLATVFFFLNETEIDNLVGLLVECKDTFSASMSDVTS